MNYESAKRIVAMTRQKKSYAAMAKSGDLTKAEAEAMQARCDQEIAAVRAQGDLQLHSPAPAPAGKASGRA